MKILIIDDDLVDRKRLKRYLKESIFLQSSEISESVDLANGLKSIQNDEFDCILLDFSLPDGDGLNFLKELHEQKIKCPPIIMQTVLDDEETGMKLIEAGAQDYLVKGKFDSNLLTRTIRYAIERYKLIQQKEQTVRELQNALSQVKKLEGIIPICSMCKKVRDDKGFWEQVEDYIYHHTDVLFSHSLCPDCMKEYKKREGIPD